MKITLFTLGVVAAVGAMSAPADACTNLIATKGAMADGSNVVTYAADSHTLYGELYHQPAADHPKGAMRKVFDWDTGKFLGEIPEVPHTYNVVGNMNEHQLVIGESTWGGRKECEDTTGQAIIDYGSLIYITLQRAKTAREAIDIMADLVDKYGYASSGESFSIADKDEVWVMELIGKGAEKGAVWIAVRIPDGAISGHANQPRIRQVDFKDKKNVKYSKDVVDFARKKGWYTGKDKDFAFADVYEEYDYGTLRGCDARVWSFFRRFNKDADKYYAWCNGESTEPMPLYIFPDRKITLAEMQERMRDHFEDTPFTMTEDVGAGPNKVPYRWRPMDFKVDGKQYSHERAIATQQTGWSFVAQCRPDLPDPVGGLIWFGTDDTNTCVYMPFYCSMTEIPLEVRHGNGDMNTYSDISNFWMTNRVANQAYHRYDLMIPDIRKVQGSLENKYQQGRPATDEALIALYNSGDSAGLIAAVNAEGASIAKEATDAYRDLDRHLLVRFMDGNMKNVDENGNFMYTKDGMPTAPKFPGYNQEYFDIIVEKTGDHFLDKGKDIAPLRNKATK
ncbi:MAG: C69 family dipeptidase [Prevotella sp.]|nr:C69 family dipeptidase [Prevotella sp.]MCM1075488.1 C69 family dipeptidase [Ruminococcus sp.]